MEHGERRVRNLGGWGFEGEHVSPPPALLAWLRAHVGEAGPPLRRGSSLPNLPAPRALGEMPLAISTDERDRLAHARGQGLPDLVRVRAGVVERGPDGVVRPNSADEVEAVLRACAARGVRVVPWGGGTSVTGGVNTPVGEAPVLVMDLENLAGLAGLDELSQLATFGAGTSGPAVEAALGPTLTLGHFPQSWELSTVGGWVATRSSGQESLGYGRIENMVAGLEVVAPAGRLSVAPSPATAAGPDPRQLVAGSEGRLGVITSVTLRVRRRPDAMRIEAALLPSFEQGLAVIRAVAQSRVPLDMLRLSDAAESAVAMAVGMGSSPFGALLTPYLRLRGVGAGASLLLFAAAGTATDVRTTIHDARGLARRQGAVLLGRRPGRSWSRDRFRHPYLRDALLDAGYATETFETAAPWSRLEDVRASIARAVTAALEPAPERVAVLCHVSHVYPDGASLYFTLFFPTGTPEATLERWARIKRAANAAVRAAGATISHHHGVGAWHAPEYASEVGPLGHAAIEAAARAADPTRTLNPHVLLDPNIRLDT